MTGRSGGRKDIHPVPMDCVKNRDGLMMIESFGTHRRESSAPWACAVRRRLRRFRCARAMRGDDDARDGLIERIGRARARGEFCFGLRSIIAVQRRARKIEGDARRDARAWDDD